MMVAGPSGCGKTTFVCNLIKNITRLIFPKIEKIKWCNPEISAIPRNIVFPDIDFYTNIPEELNENENKPTLIVLDDLMLDSANKQVCELFTKGSHHRNLSIILLTQNVFHQGKFSRDISLNCKYLVLFKNPRDKSQIFPLARQLYPENIKGFLGVYNESTSNPHGYIVLDLTQDVNDLFRIRTNIFSEEYSVCFCATKDLNNCLKYETIEEKPTYVTCSRKMQQQEFS